MVSSGGSSSSSSSAKGRGGGGVTVELIVATAALLAGGGSVYWWWMFHTRQRPQAVGGADHNNKKESDCEEPVVDDDNNCYLGERKKNQKKHQQQLTLQHPYVQRRISDRLSYHDFGDHGEDSDGGGDDGEEEEDDDISCVWSNDANWHHFEGYDRDGNRVDTNTTTATTMDASTSTSSTVTATATATLTGTGTTEAVSTRSRSPTTTSTPSTMIPRPHRNAARQRYNTHIMPPTVLLVRHGQSMGNVNESLYATISDNAMPLTALGWEQARAAGRHLKDTVFRTNSTNNTSKTNIHFIVSPYVRTWETFHGMLAAWVDPRSVSVDAENTNSSSNTTSSTEARHLAAWYAQLHAQGLSWHEDPRIREQDFGNFQNPQQIRTAKADRHRFGAFYYRFPHGESASDVYDRVSTFLDSLWRSFDVHTSRNYVLVTHGISIRVILARYYRYSIDQFHILANPKNCECVALEHDGKGKLMLSGRYELVVMEDDDEAGEDNKETTTNNNTEQPPKKIRRRLGYQHHRQLSVLPATQVHTVHARMMHYGEDDDDDDASAGTHAPLVVGTCP